MRSKWMTLSVLAASALLQVACSQSSGDKISACLSDAMCRQVVASQSGATGTLIPGTLTPVGTTGALTSSAAPAVLPYSQPLTVAQVASTAVRTQSVQAASATANELNSLPASANSPRVTTAAQLEAAYGGSASEEAGAGAAR